ncbi:MAG: SIMPL domain-containing protein [bacterium]|nr:SIMPL domain-containing protein [bacterium]
MEIKIENHKNLHKALVVFLTVLSIFVVVKTLHSFKEDRWNGKDGGIESTIIISGHGEMKAVPDIATISFSITKEAKTIKEAQTQVTEIEKKVLEVLKTNKVDDKDIKTTNSSFYPKYKYDYKGAYYPQNSTISGYEVTENIEVKIRDIDTTGALIEGLGAIGVNNLHGPNFAIDEEDDLKDEARKLAIDDAKDKAQQLAKDLGVRLGKIVSFSENSNYPIIYAKNESLVDSAQSSAPELPKGENTISSNVTITYKIR